MSGVPSTAITGTAFNITITAKDQNGSLAGGYLGTVHFTSTDGLAGLPSDYTFGAGDLGAHTFSVTLKTAGTQTITATDTVTGSLTVTTPNITVSTAAASVFLISAPATSTAGAAFNATVTAKDAFGNTATSYTGTVHFTSTDGQAVLPANYTFVAGDNGSHQVSATLKTAGNQTITATDTNTSSITGSSTTISVAGAAANVFTVSAPASVTTGGAFTVTVTAKDAFGNVATGYTGTVHFTSSDGAAVLPANYTFVAGDNGVHQFSVTMNTTGPQSITATDTVTGSITGNTNTTVTSANPATHFSVSVPSSATAGSSFSITITALECRQRHRRGLPRHGAFHEHRRRGHPALELHLYWRG